MFFGPNDGKKRKMCYLRGTKITHFSLFTKFEKSRIIGSTYCTESICAISWISCRVVVSQMKTEFSPCSS